MSIFNDLKQYQSDETERKRLEQRLRNVLQKEGELIKQLNASIMKEFAALNISVLTHAQYFDKGSYTQAQVQGLLLKIRQFIDTFSNMAKVAGDMTEDRSMEKLKEYSLKMVAGLKRLHEAIKSNELNFGQGYARKIKSAEDIFDELNKILKEARESLSREQRVKYDFVWHEFQEVKKAA